MDSQALESLVAQQLQTHNVAGLALAIVDRDEIIYEQAGGKDRVIPVLQLKTLFPPPKKGK